MKRLCRPLLLCVLFAGCAKSTDPFPSDNSRIPSAPDVISEPETLSEPTVSDPAEESSSAGVIPIPPDETVSVYDGLRFRLPEGWGNGPDSAADVRVNTVSISLLDEPHKSLSLTAVMDGKLVC